MDPFLTMSDVISKGFYQWNFTDLTANPNIGLDDIITYHNLPWRWDYISEFADIDTVIQLISKKWCWDRLSEQINIYDILNNPELPWNYNYVSINPTLETQIVLDLPNLPWDFRAMSGNLNIDYRIIPDPDYHLLSKRLPYHAILELEKLLNYKQLSKNPNITLDYVLQHNDKPWDYTWLSANPAFDTLDISNQKIPWCPNGLAMNPNIPLKKDNVAPQYLSWKADINEVIQNPHQPWIWHILTDRFDIYDIYQNWNLPWHWLQLKTKKIRNLG